MLKNYLSNKLGKPDGSAPVSPVAPPKTAKPDAPPTGKVAELLKRQQQQQQEPVNMIEEDDDENGEDNSDASSVAKPVTPVVVQEKPKRPKKRPAPSADGEPKKARETKEGESEAPKRRIREPVCPPPDINAYYMFVTKGKGANSFDAEPDAEFKAKVQTAFSKKHSEYRRKLKKYQEANGTAEAPKVATATEPTNAAAPAEPTNAATYCESKGATKWEPKVATRILPPGFTPVPRPYSEIHEVMRLIADSMNKQADLANRLAQYLGVPETQ